MSLSDNKTDFFSGYITLNENLQIEEFSGQINQILRKEHLDMNGSFMEIIENLKKKSKHFFDNEVLPAVKAKSIKHLSLHRKDSKLSVAITPLSSGSTIISFEEVSTRGKVPKETLPEELEEIVIRVNSDLQVIFASRNLTTKLGVDASAIVSKNLSEIQFFNDNATIVSTLINSVLQQHQQKSEDILVVTNQKKSWWNLRVIPENDIDKHESTALIILKDITAQKLIEEKFIEFEQRFEMSMEAADLGIWDYMVNTGRTFYSRKWKSMLGYYPDELPDQHSVWEELLHPEDKDRMLLFINNFVNSDLRVYKAEFRLRHKNGNYLWIKSRGIAIRDENGKAIRVLGTHQDITEEKKSESEFDKLHQAIMQSPISVLITDKDGYIEFFNPAFCKITGWKDQEIIGKKPNILKSGFQPASFYERLWRTISSGNEWQGEFKNRKKNGEYYWELASISPIKNSYGTITHYVKIAENISYLKKIEKDLKKAKQDAEIANNYKNHFLANMSHEIRTPINTIIGFSELLKNENLSSQNRFKYSGIIEENSQSLLRLIDDIIDIAKIEANELKIKKEACSLEELFAEFEMTYTNFLKKKQKQNIDLIFQIPEESHHDVIFTDPYRLKQIINNLFINALRNTELGHIEIGYNIVNDNKLQFFVSDTGSGIPTSQIKNIFKRFNQVEETTSTYRQGAGLGLTICKDLALLLGGDINVQSIEGEGSIFTLSIPYDKIKIPIVKAPARPAPPDRYNFSDFNIMIAEDTPYNYEYLYSILQKTGANVIWAKDGIDVLKLYNSSKIDLILMDIQLPEINGYEATAQIRQSNQTLPIIAQTAFAMTEDREKCIAAGCNDVLVKPIRMDDVLAAVAKYLQK